jgi:N-acetyl-S-(2-succino)cysteine monooxygenase
MPAYFPGAFDDFVNLVVPELQRRGLYRLDYSGPTLRDHLGLEAPSSAPATARERTAAAS